MCYVSRNTMDIASFSALERQLIPFLKEGITVEQLVRTSGMQDVEVKRALLWLGNRRLVSTDQTSVMQVSLKENGQLAKKQGLPEMVILKQLLTGKKSIEKITQVPRGEIMSCIGILKSLHAINVGKEQNTIALEIMPAGKALATNPIYEPQNFMEKYEFPLDYDTLSNEEKHIVDDLKKRKEMLLVMEVKTITVHVSKDVGLIDVKQFENIEEHVTPAMLKDGSWKKKIFRKYDVESPVPVISGGRRHPLREANNLIRDIYLNMGFTEMSGPWVETAFWCMDSMWIPQDHPARDVQDTFFLGKQGDLPSKELVEKVRSVHETGGKTGSTGYQKPWDETIAKELILRTHSTATSFRKLAELGNQDGKYFYVANVFRNEAVDTTHLAEFLQAEGFVVGDNLTLSDLMGFIKDFYARLGIHKIRFKPTYNPYTEPSIEAHYYDEQKGKWYALINSGIFRPESLEPYGIKKTVIAWGMGASRVAALLNHKTNLRELVGPTVDIEWIATHKKPQPNLED